MTSIIVLATGVPKTTMKGDSERRLPIHPEHIRERRIPAHLLANMLFEAGYGDDFGMGDEELARLTCGRVGTHAETLSQSLVIAPKLTQHELHFAQLARTDQGEESGTIFCGWPHFESGEQITQAAIDGKHTVLAWESMFEVDGKHTFWANNELAGYAGMIHFLDLMGEDGLYGVERRVAVFSHGWVSRGAIKALWARGYRDITVFTGRAPGAVGVPVRAVRFRQLVLPEGAERLCYLEDGQPKPLIQFMSQCGIVVNGILQDKLHPRTFIHDDERHLLQRDVMVADISCDTAPMGFGWARPTTFADPTFPVELSDGHVGTYYGVDHTPTFLHRAATMQISAALIPLLPHIMAGPDAWRDHPVLWRACEVLQGTVLNPKILQLQGRDAEYPHQRQAR